MARSGTNVVGDATGHIIVESVSMANKVGAEGVDVVVAGNSIGMTKDEDEGDFPTKTKEGAEEVAGSNFKVVLLGEEIGIERGEETLTITNDANIRSRGVVESWVLLGMLDEVFEGADD